MFRTFREIRLQNLWQIGQNMITTGTVAPSQSFRTFVPPNFLSQLNVASIKNFSTTPSGIVIPPSFRTLALPPASISSQLNTETLKQFSTGKEALNNNGGNNEVVPKEDRTGEVHFKSKQKTFWENSVPDTVYNEADLMVVKTHHDPTEMSDRIALFAVKCMRGGFDLVSRYKGPGGQMTKRDWLNRCLFLETVAGVPGMVSGMCRHLKSLRTMHRDYGWIHTLLEEAENERMHLLIFMKMKNPSLMFRVMVLAAQGVFFNMFFLTYLVSPKTCHRFVGYLEEEAVKTYTGMLEDLEGPEHMQKWRDESAPKIAVNYYKLEETATVKDLIQCVRADEANHRDVNHTFAGLDFEMDPNPYLQSKHFKGSQSLKSF